MNDPSGDPKHRLSPLPDPVEAPTVDPALAEFVRWLDRELEALERRFPSPRPIPTSRTSWGLLKR